MDLAPANEILPLIGSKEGVMHISLAFLNEGDGVLIPNPGYPTYASVSKLTGARILPYALKEENDWQPDFEALEKMDLSGVKLMCATTPTCLREPTVRGSCSKNSSPSAAGTTS